MLTFLQLLVLADRPALASRPSNRLAPNPTRVLRRPVRALVPEKTYGTAEGKTPANVNAYTGGWSVTNTTRLMYTNGQLDPWRDVTVSSDYRPGGPLQSTPQLPVRVIPGGIHCSDYYGQNWAVNPTLQGIVNDEVANMVQWVDEYYTQTKRRWPKRAEEWEA
jgi:hypothetical protein